MYMTSITVGRVGGGERRLFLYPLLFQVVTPIRSPFHSCREARSPHERGKRRKRKKSTTGAEQTDKKELTPLERVAYRGTK